MANSILDPMNTVTALVLKYLLGTCPTILGTLSPCFKPEDESDFSIWLELVV